MKEITKLVLQATVAAFITWGLTRVALSARFHMRTSTAEKAQEVVALERIATALEKLETCR